MPDSDSQIKLLSMAKKIIQEIQAEIKQLKTEGTVDKPLLITLNKINSDTKHLLNMIRDKVFMQTKLTDFK
jgi:hypothetical protein